MLVRVCVVPVVPARVPGFGVGIGDPDRFVLHNSYYPHGPANLTQPAPHEAAYDAKRPWIKKLRNPTLMPKLVDTRGKSDSWWFLRGYYNDVQRLDKEFEEFLGVVRRSFPDKAKSVTIFLSDHGGSIYGKWSCYNAGLHIPFYVQLKGFGAEIKSATRRIRALASLVDVLPTLLDLARLPHPSAPATPLDGRSLLPLLRGDTPEVPVHEHVFGSHTARGARCVANPYPIRSVFDGRWKLIRNLASTYSYQVNMLNARVAPKADLWINAATSPAASAYNRHWAKFLTCRPHEELYDVATDPDEIYNLINHSHLQDVRTRLAAALETWMADVQDTDPVAAELAIPVASRQMIYQSVAEPEKVNDYGCLEQVETPSCADSGAPYPGPATCFGFQNNGRLRRAYRIGNTSFAEHQSTCAARCASYVGCKAYSWRSPTVNTTVATCDLSLRAGTEEVLATTTWQRTFEV